MIDADALGFLAELATKAETPHLVERTSRTATFLWRGQERRVGLEEPARETMAHRLSSVVDAIAAYTANEDKGSSSTIWINESEVVAVIDDCSDIRSCDRTTMPLEKTDAWSKMVKLQKDPFLDHKGFCRLLAIDLRFVEGTQPLLSLVRRIRIENGEVTTQEKRSAKESLGREINSRVQAVDGEIPEEVDLVVKLYRGIDISRSIKCSVEIDPQAGRFRLAPLPDQCDLATESALSEIRGKIAEHLEFVGLPKVDVFFGCPNCP